MALITESLQNDLSKMKMDQLRMFIGLLATFLQIKDNQMETNKSLQHVNHFINLMEEAKRKYEKGDTEDFEMPFEISYYNGDMRPEVQAALDAEGVKYVMMASADGNLLITDTAERTRKIMNAIRSGGHELINGAAANVAIDPKTFGEQHSNVTCYTYANLNAQEVNEFKRLAQMSGFQFALSEQDGHYAVTVTKDVALRCNLDAFAQECAIFNRSGLYGAYREFEAMQAKEIQDKFREDVFGKKADAVVYVDTKSPANYYVVKEDGVECHSPTESKFIPKSNLDLGAIEASLAGKSREGIANFVKISLSEFEQQYKIGPLDKDARMAFAQTQHAYTELQKHSSLIQQIARTAENSLDVNPLQAMAKRYKARAESTTEPLPENIKKTLLDFSKAVEENDRAKIQEMLRSGEIAGIRGTIESQMIQKALNNTLTAREFVYGTVMASAERMAQTPETKTAIVANAFNIGKIDSMLKTGDAIASGFATAENPQLAEDFTNIFSKATIDISSAEISNNCNFMGDVRDTIAILRMQQTIQGMIEYANGRDNSALAEELKTTKLDDLVIKIAKVAAGASPEDAGIQSVTSKKEADQFLDIFTRASMDTMANPQMTVAKLSKHPNIKEHFGSSMFADIMSKVAIQDMERAELSTKRMVVKGKDLTTSLGEFDMTDSRFDTQNIGNDGHTEKDDMDQIDL